MTGHNIPFYKVDLMDTDALREVFKKHAFKAVMHFAGLKAVGESCEKPLSYYRNNIDGTVSLLEVMLEFGVYNIVFSSSATVYGIPQHLPVNEEHPAGACTNPYGRTKFFIEQIILDLCDSDERWNGILLRYFNPVGAHKSGRIGEDPQGPPNNLMPYVAQVAVGRRPHLNVYGNDYDTADGTGVRDYIHVVDLALGHVAALKMLLKENCHCKVYNLGTGVGYSVFEMIKAFEAASSRKVPYEVVGRRQGDIDTLYADPALALRELNWKANKGLKEMCEDLWRWQSLNPTGFGDTK